MFIRKKLINGTQYAYLIENEWTQVGSRQKSTTYLGRVVTLGTIKHPFAQPVADEPARAYLLRLLNDLFECAGFVRQNNIYTLGDVSVNVDKQVVRRRGRPAVIELNEGFLCDMTLHNFLRFGERKYSVDLQAKHLHPGRVLAQRMLEVGLTATPEQFILTFEYLVPNSDVLLKYM